VPTNTTAPAPLPTSTTPPERTPLPPLPADMLIKLSVTFRCVLVNGTWECVPLED
jgi:hypothetical protein